MTSNHENRLILKEGSAPGSLYNFFFIPYPERSRCHLQIKIDTQTTRSSRKHYSLLLQRQKINQEASATFKNIFFNRIIIAPDKIITELLEN